MVCYKKICNATIYVFDGGISFYISRESIETIFVELLEGLHYNRIMLGGVLVSPNRDTQEDKF